MNISNIKNWELESAGSLGFYIGSMMNPLVEQLQKSEFGKAVMSAKMENLPYSKRFFPSDELVWCLNEVRKAGMPFKFPTFSCKKCHGRGFTGHLNTPVDTGAGKEYIRKPIPCKCLLENDPEKLKAFAKAKKAKYGTPDSVFNQAHGLAADGKTLLR
jgi:hypothetical protein